MKRWLKIGIPILVVLLGFYLFGRQLTVSVLTEGAVTGTAVNAVTGTVEVLANMDISVKTENRGQILKNEVQAGDKVEAGEVSARQDSEDLDLRIEQVEIRLEAARARLELESTHAIDLETLDEEMEGVRLAVELKQRPLSQLQRLERDRRKKTVQLNLEQIQERENLKLLENQLAQLELERARMITTAPFAGTVTELSAFKGDLVGANQKLVRLVSQGRYIMMELTEEDYFGVESGQSVTLRLASYPDRTFSGTVARLEDVANAKNKTRKLVVNVEAPDSVLVPGLSGEGYLVKDERSNAVLIPRRALIGNLVYVVRRGKVEVRRVKVGYSGLKQAEIIEGIESGERIIIDDQNLLKPGQRVREIRSEG